MINRLVKILISLYRVLISPLLPPSCRFYPSCSKYAHDAFSLMGPFKALYLTIRRLGRCHPFNDGGFDPVPLPADKKDRAGARLLSNKEGF